MESQTTIGENDSQIMTAGDIVKCKQSELFVNNQALLKKDTQIQLILQS